MDVPIAPAGPPISCESSGNVDEKLRRQLGQMLIVGFDGFMVSDTIRTMIEKYHIGSIFLSTKNIKDAHQVASLAKDLQAIAKSSGHEHPLLIGVDQENGMISRLGYGRRATQFPGSMAISATRSPSLAYDIAKATARELKAVGINWNFAPVLDVLAASSEPVFAVRSFSDDPQAVGKFGGAFVQGFRAGGIASCVKHFPGTSSLGRTSRHVDGFGPEKIREDLEDHELVPFRRGVAHDGLDSIMLAPSILRCGSETDVARTSEHVVLEMLRRQLGYLGIVVTDCSEDLSASTTSSRSAPIISIKTGADMIFINDQLSALVSAVEEIYSAFINGDLRSDLFERASGRVATLKRHYLQWDTALRDPSDDDLSALMVEHEILARKAYEASITLVRADKSTMSALGRLHETDIVLLLTPVVRPLYPPDETIGPIDPFECFGRALAARHAKIRQVPYTVQTGITSVHVAFIKRASVVILVTCNSIRPQQSPQIKNAKLVRAVCGGKPLVALAACDPCDLLTDKSFLTYICTYEYTKPALEAAAAVIFGERHAPGILPIYVPGTAAKRTQRSWKVDIWEKRRDAFATADLWKQAFGQRRVMDAATLNALLDRPGLSKHYVVRDPTTKELLGLCSTYLTPRDRDELVGSVALLLVRPTHRNLGVGLSLHNVAVRELTQAPGMVTLQLGSIFPRFFPGLPTDLPTTDLDWFSRRGWKLDDEKFIYDLFLDTRKDRQRWEIPLDSALIPAMPESNTPPISYTICRREQFPDLISFQESHFPSRGYPGWLEKYMNLRVSDDIADVILAIIPGSGSLGHICDTSIVGAAIVYTSISNSQIAKDIPWPRLMGERFGGIACLSVHPDYRKTPIVTQGLLRASIAELVKRGMIGCFVDWAVADWDWYQSLGFTNWGKYREIWRSL